MLKHSLKCQMHHSWFSNLVCINFGCIIKKIINFIQRNVRTSYRAKNNWGVLQESLRIGIQAKWVKRAITPRTGGKLSQGSSRLWEQDKDFDWCHYHTHICLPYTQVCFDYGIVIRRLRKPFSSDDFVACLTYILNFWILKFRLALVKSIYTRIELKWFIGFWDWFTFIK